MRSKLGLLCGVGELNRLDNLLQGIQSPLRNDMYAPPKARRLALGLALSAASQLLAWSRQRKHFTNVHTQVSQSLSYRSRY
jgi:hypothetical protein